MQEDDSIFSKQRTFKAEELIRGERLFYGLAYPASKSINCASCHNTQVVDTLNWNPDAVEISQKYLNRSARDLSSVLLNPKGPKMLEVHKGIELTTEDIILIKAYMDKIAGMGLKQTKPVITNLLLFLMALILFLFSLYDIIITKLIRNQWINKVIVPVTGIYMTWVLVVNAIALGRSKDYSPGQPVKFSHTVHAGQNQINCLYCHSYAPYSKSAGIPANNICMNCHLLVRNGTRSGVTEILKVIDAFENRKPIEWVRVYNLPDFVFFSHAQHTGAGEIGCLACHDKVEEMHILSQVPDLSMGWCLDCHDTRAVRITSGYYRRYFPLLYNSLISEEVDSVRVALTGGRDCGTCHY